MFAFASVVVPTTVDVLASEAGTAAMVAASAGRLVLEKPGAYIAPDAASPVRTSSTRFRSVLRSFE